MDRVSLNLVGDEDLEGLLEDVFDLRFSDDELRSMTTVGAIHDVIDARLPERAGACETSMTFYRLRRGLTLMGATGRIAPAMPLPEAFSLQARKSLKSLATASGLVLPQTIGGPLAMAALLISAAAGCCFLIGLVAHLGFLIGLGVATSAVAVVCARLDPGQLPGSLATIGDLARWTAAQNFGRLVGQGARVRSELIWPVLCDLIADTAGISPSEIGRETLIYSPKKAAA